MKPLTSLWVDKAEDDLRLARQSRRTKSPVFDGICFHAQQCAEKYLKALLHEQSIRTPHTHDLADLIALLDPPVAAITALSADAQWLSIHAVDIRYPGASANQADADRALKIATAFRRLIRRKLAI